MEWHLRFHGAVHEAAHGPRHHAVHSAIHQRLNSPVNDPIMGSFHGLSMGPFQPRARSSKQRIRDSHSRGCSCPVIRLLNNPVNLIHGAIHGASSKVLITCT